MSPGKLSLAKAPFSMRIATTTATTLSTSCSMIAPAVVTTMNSATPCGRVASRLALASSTCSSPSTARAYATMKSPCVLRTLSSWAIRTLWAGELSNRRLSRRSSRPRWERVYSTQGLPLTARPANSCCWTDSTSVRCAGWSSSTVRTTLRRTERSLKARFSCTSCPAIATPT